MFVVNLPFLTSFFDFRLFCPRKYQILVFRPKIFFKKSKFFRSVPVVEKNRNSHKLLIYIINVTTKNFRSLGLSKSVQGRPKVKDKKTVIFHYLYIYSKTSKQDTNTWHLYKFDKLKLHLLFF